MLSLTHTSLRRPLQAHRLRGRQHGASPRPAGASPLSIAAAAARKAVARASEDDEASPRAGIECCHSASSVFAAAARAEDAGAAEPRSGMVTPCMSRADPLVLSFAARAAKRHDLMGFSPAQQLAPRGVSPSPSRTVGALPAAVLLASGEDWASSPDCCASIVAGFVRGAAVLLPLPLPPLVLFGKQLPRGSRRLSHSSAAKVQCPIRLPPSSVLSSRVAQQAAHHLQWMRWHALPALGCHVQALASPAGEAAR